MNLHVPTPAPPPPAHAKATTEIDRRIGERIRALRIAAGLSQTALGAAVGITFQQTQKYENGQNRVSAARLAQFAGILGVPVATFFDDATPASEGGDVFALLAQPGAADLLRAFAAIEDRGRRNALLTLARAERASDMAPRAEP